MSDKKCRDFDLDLDFDLDIELEDYYDKAEITFEPTDDFIKSLSKKSNEEWSKFDKSFVSKEKVNKYLSVKRNDLITSVNCIAKSINDFVSHTNSIVDFETSDPELKKILLTLKDKQFDINEALKEIVVNNKSKTILEVALIEKLLDSIVYLNKHNKEIIKKK